MWGGLPCPSCKCCLLIPYLIVVSSLISQKAADKKRVQKSHLMLASYDLLIIQADYLPLYCHPQTCRFGAKYTESLQSYVYVIVVLSQNTKWLVTNASLPLPMSSLNIYNAFRTTSEKKSCFPKQGLFILLFSYTDNWLDTLTGSIKVAYLVTTRSTWPLTS